MCRPLSLLIVKSCFLEKKYIHDNEAMKITAYISKHIYIYQNDLMRGP